MVWIQGILYSNLCLHWIISGFGRKGPGLFIGNTRNCRCWYLEGKKTAGETQQISSTCGSKSVCSSVPTKLPSVNFSPQVHPNPLSILLIFIYSWNANGTYGARLAVFSLPTVKYWYPTIHCLKIWMSQPRSLGAVSALPLTSLGPIFNNLHLLGPCLPCCLNEGIRLPEISCSPWTA